MKKIIFSSFIAFNCILQAQDWQSIPNSHFGTCCDFVLDPNFVNKHFKVNPFTNDIWMSYGNSASFVDQLGIFHLFTYPSEPLFIGTSPFFDFQFYADNVYALRSNKGLYQFRNDSWTNPITALDCESFSRDNDTLWISMNNNLNFKKYFNNTVEDGSKNFSRSYHQNGVFWYSPTQDSGLGFETNGIYKSYAADTSLLLSPIVLDAKFSKYDDRFYVAGDSGISVAQGYTFIDSICPYSSVNMPSPGIIEFEFDKQNNIWALFGSKLNWYQYSNKGIGYYDQGSRSWTRYYDASNSPINFGHMLSIEVDTNDNLWVVQKDTLHVLKLGLTPAWLQLAELETPSFELAPNPGSNEINIIFNQALAQNSRMTIYDLHGKTVMEVELSTGVKQIHLETSQLAPGSYLISLSEGLGGYRWVKQ